MWNEKYELCRNMKIWSEWKIIEMTEEYVSKVWIYYLIIV